MLKPPSVLTQGFKYNNKSQENILNHMCNFLSQEDWRNIRIAVSSYLGVYTSKDKYRLINSTPLDCIAGYIMEDYVGDRYLKRIPHIRVNFIDGYISSY